MWDTILKKKLDWAVQFTSFLLWPQLFVPEQQSLLSYSYKVMPVAEPTHNEIYCRFHENVSCYEAQQQLHQVGSRKRNVMVCKFRFLNIPVACTYSEILCFLTSCYASSLDPIQNNIPVKEDISATKYIYHFLLINQYCAVQDARDNVHETFMQIWAILRPECLPLISLIQEPFCKVSMREMEAHEWEKGLEENKARGVCVCTYVRMGEIHVLMYILLQVIGIQ